MGRKHGNSSVSRVDIDFFDREGVQQLQRTLTRQHEEEKDQRRRSTSSSDRTLGSKSDEPFDFAKTLRSIVRQYVVSSFLVGSVLTKRLRREEQNIKSRSLGIGFSDLRVTGVTAANSYYDTLGSLLNPKVIMENIQAARHPSLRNILSGFEGVVKPGEMLRSSTFF